MNKLKIILIFLLIGAISIIGGAYFKINSTTSHENFETKIFYNSITKNINNENVALSKFKGKWLLINFWATWCAPCREEIPDLNNLFNENKKINLIGIAIDEGHIASIDESASTYITEWADDDRSKITIRNLLDMRSGLEPMCGGSDSTEMYKCDQLLNGGQLVWADNQNDKCIPRDLAETGIKQSWYYDRFQPDATFEEGYMLYSNCDTQNLGEIIFRATGKTLQQYGDEKLFSKIGMNAYWWKDNENEGQDNKKWSCSGLPMDDEEWSSASETDESDYDSDALYDSD